MEADGDGTASDVEHEAFDDLDAAIAEMKSRRGGSGRGAADALLGPAHFEPEDQVHARLQISGRGLLRKPTAGIDVRGTAPWSPSAGRWGARS